MKFQIGHALTLAFALFSLVAISASSGARTQRQKKLKEQREALLARQLLENKPSEPLHVYLHSDQSVKSVTDTIKSVIPNAEVVLSDQAVAKPATKVEQAPVVATAASIQTSEAQKTTVVSQPVMAAQQKIAEPVVLAAPIQQEKVQQRASAAFLLIPSLFLVTALVAVKQRKAGYLPDSVEEKLEEWGFPAQSDEISFSDAPSWKKPSVFRSTYGSV